MESFNEDKFLKNANSFLEEIYPHFNEILGLDKKYSYSSIKQGFKNKIFIAKDYLDKIKINMSFEYFISDPNNIKTYNPDDKSKLKKYTKFNPTLLVVMKKFEDFKAYFLSKKSELNSTFDESLRSLLYLSCKCGYKEFVIFLLENGADPEKKQINGSIPLHAACYYRHKEIVDLLLEAGCSYKIKNDFNNLPEDEAPDDIKEFMQKYKNDIGYNFFIDNRLSFKNIKLIYDDDKKLVGKRCSLNEDNKDWDLAWHGTLMKYIPSIIKYGLKKCGETVDGKEIDIRKDTPRIKRDKKFRERNKWAEAVFTSFSVFYSTTRAYAEHFKDNKDIEWVIVLECRIKPGTYESSEHTFGESGYTLVWDESKLVENRSENSAFVSVSALWYLDKQNYIKAHNRSYKGFIETIEKYIL